MSHPYMIKVEGEIRSIEGNHYAQGFACRSVGGDLTNKPYTFDRVTHTVTSDLILDRNHSAAPYAIYYTDKGITGNSIVCSSGVDPAVLYFRDNMDEIKQLMGLEIPLCLSKTVANQLYLDIFGVLELFLCDFLLCAIFSFEESYKKAEAIVQTKGAENSEIGPDKMENKIHELFLSQTIYHRFDRVDKYFSSIIGIKIPSYKALETALHKRNNIIHRASLSNIDRMTFTPATLKNVSELFIATQKFVVSLLKEYDNTYQAHTLDLFE